MKGKALLVLFSISVGFAFAFAKEDLQKLESKLANHNSKLSHLGASIKSLEDNIGKKNNDYIYWAQVSKKIENKINHNLREVGELISKIQLQKHELRALTGLIVLEHDDPREEELIERSLLKNLYQKKFQKLKGLTLTALTITNGLREEKGKLNEVQAREKELYELVMTLEERKKEHSKNYLSFLSSKEKILNHVQMLKAKKLALREQLKREQGVVFFLENPIRSFVGKKKSSKGVSFYYTKEQNIYSPGPGKVVYSGSLSTYGKLVMIDHGQDVRSVILGNLKLIKKKGDQVRSNELLAKAYKKRDQASELYFEVRKNNLHQNALAWLKNETVGKI